MKVDRTKGFWNKKEETMSKEEKKRLDTKNLLFIFRHAYNNSPFYKKLYQDAGLTPEDIKTLDDIRKIPLITKPELQEAQKKDPPFGGLLAVPLNKLSEIFISPGPIYEGGMADEEQKLIEAGAKAAYSCGIRPGDIVHNAFLYHLVPAGLGLHMCLRHMGCTVIPMGIGQTVYQAIIMRDLGATAFTGTPSFLAMIGEEAKKGGIDPKNDLKLEVGLFTAEPLPESLRKHLEDTFDMLARQMYGTADVGGISRECPEVSGMHLEETLIVELIDPKTKEPVAPGEEGDVTVTLPHKLATPFIRFRTGDGSVLSEEKCGCGRTSPKLMRILGRVDALTKVKGMFVHPANIKTTIRKHPELGNYEAIVDRPGLSDVLTIRIEFEGTGQTLPKEASEAKKVLEDEFKEMIRVKAEVELVPKGLIKETKEQIIDLRKFD
ncbi:MAG: AMP-binding protein [Candidatus Freyarchaeota archaeon]|nr:AMP-binding protein [Candidatus Jordarchaeia archaeon]MBS7269188.1 AMP-binding protein [Candidatus Jordarchaeia archaeon]MBS7279549.1 AMP-binding protein [Candidatus Jordarchaeia archaeon]